MNNLESISYTLPAYWASYLINGDASGISDENKAQADAFLEREGLPGPVSCSDESWFSWHNDATRLGGDVMDYVFLIEPKPAKPLTDAEKESIRQWSKTRQNDNAYKPSHYR